MPLLRVLLFFLEKGIFDNRAHRPVIRGAFCGIIQYLSRCRADLYFLPTSTAKIDITAPTSPPVATKNYRQVV